MLYKKSFLSNSPYSFTADAGGNSFQFHIKHDMLHDTYYMDIDIKRDQQYTPLFCGLALTCGCNLFQHLQHYGLGTFMVIPIDPDYYYDNNRDITQTKEIPHADTIVNKFIILWEHD